MDDLCFIKLLNLARTYLHTTHRDRITFRPSIFPFKHKCREHDSYEEAQDSCPINLFLANSQYIWHKM